MQASRPDVRWYGTLPAVVTSPAVMRTVAVAIRLFAIALQFFPFGLVQGTVAIGTVCFAAGVAVTVFRTAGTITRSVAMVVIVTAMGIRLQGRNKRETGQRRGSDQKTASGQYHGILRLVIDTISRYLKIMDLSNMFPQGDICRRTSDA